MKIFAETTLLAAQMMTSVFDRGPVWLSGSALGQDTSEPQTSTGETQERHE